MSRMFWLSLFLAIGALSGCGGDGLDFQVAPVNGIVLQEGSPLVNGYVEYWPVDGKRPSLARTNDQGQFELSYNSDVKGAAVGMCSVKIGTGGIPDPNDPDGRTDLPKKELLVQEIEVVAGDNMHEFDVPLSGANRKKK